MRYSEFRLVEASSGVTWGVFSKDNRRDKHVANMLNYIQDGKPFTTMDGKLFVFDNTPENVNAIKNWSGNPAPVLTGRYQGEAKPETLSIAKLAKTNVFSGQAQDLSDPDAVAGKERMIGRTAHLDLHGVSKDEEKAIGDMKRLVQEKGIKGSELLPKIINNTVLNSEAAQPHGGYIVDIAKNIQAGNYPFSVAPEVFAEERFHKFIQDYAGEYLGVAALVNGIGEFPNKDKFLEFLGASDLRELDYYFPQGENTPLADSFGFIKSPTGEHEMKISSKGGVKGASPSMSNLKVPDDFPKTDSNADDLEFIRIVQENSQIAGTLKALNFLKENYPSSLKEFEITEYLPITDQEIDFFETYTSKEQKDYKAVNINDFPERLRPYAEMRQAQGGVKSNTGDFIMAATRAVLDAINKNGALPEFEKTTKEILGYNFIQIFTRLMKSKGGLVRVLWPAKIDGNVTLYSNSSQTGMNGRLGFSIT